MKFADWILKVEGKPPRSLKTNKVDIEWPERIYHSDVMIRLIRDVLTMGVDNLFEICNLDHAFEWSSHSAELVFSEAYHTEMVSQELYDICSSWNENFDTMPPVV